MIEVIKEVQVTEANWYRWLNQYGSENNAGASKGTSNGGPTNCGLRTWMKDALHKVRMSKKLRIDPHRSAGPGWLCWSIRAWFPLEVHLFEGNKAETTTPILVLTAFHERHGATDRVASDEGTVRSGRAFAAPW